MSIRSSVSLGHFLALLVLLTAALLPDAAMAQRQRPYAEIGLAGGGMNYIGDLNNQSLFGKVHPAASAYLRYNFDDRWAVSIIGAYGTLEGGNPDVLAWRNLSFKSFLWETGVRAELNFVRFGFNVEQYRTTPYIFVGLSVFFFNPMAQYIDTVTGESRWVDLEPLGTEGQHSDLYPDVYPYGMTTVCMPFGLGFKARLSDQIVFSFEYGFRKTWTDYIDDVSTRYADPAIFEDNPVALALSDRSGEVKNGHLNAPGTQRGDDSLDDWYSYFNISLSIGTDFLFGWAKKKRCYND